MNTLEKCRWMLDLAKAGLAGARPGRLGEVEFDERAWGELYDLSYEHGLAPLVEAGLRICAIEPPSAVAEKFARHSRASRLRAMQAGDQFRQISQSFAEKGIEVIALKGVPLAFRRYADPGLRRFKDIDILVRPSDLDRAGAVLDSLGYHSLDADEADQPSFFVDTPAKYHSGYERGNEFPVELHWDLVPKRSPVQFNIAGLWERSLPWEGWGAARELSLEDEVVFMAAHMSRHEFLFPARAFFDLAVILKQQACMDADSLWRRAAGCNATVDLAVALGVAGELGVVELSPELAARLAQTARANKLNTVRIARYALTWPTFEYAERAVGVLAAPTPIDTLRRLGQTLFPRYSSLVEREEKSAPSGVGIDSPRLSYTAMWRKRIGHWTRKARNWPAEAANLQMSVRMRRTFSNRTVREDD